MPRSFILQQECYSAKCRCRKKKRTTFETFRYGSVQAPSRGDL